jgi:glucosyl-3-phosphoglycerate synthase
MPARVRAWEQAHTHHHSEFPAARLAAERTDSVSVCLPARNEAATIGPIVSALAGLLDAGVIDQLVVVDDSTDGTGEIAASAGAEVYAQAALVPEAGPVLGKGDAMWRALTVLSGEVICFLDADSQQFGDHFARGLLGPLLLGGGAGGESGAGGENGAGGESGLERTGEVQFVKGFYRRPFKLGDYTLPDGGGRVTELTARPLLETFYPELAAVRQPLAGEIAARRGLLERLAFRTGYGVDIALLIDAYRTVGLERIAQVDLDVRQNSHQALHDLAPMARAVLEAVNARLVREGRLSMSVTDAVIERPPRVSARAPA